MRHGRRRRRAKTALVCLALILLCWTAGFYWFTRLIPAPGPASEEATDAIVVLTGGAGRVREGLRLLENGLAAKLFVSGVYRGVDVQALLRHARQEPGNLECCIVLGYVADNTRGNARETAAWIERERHRSLRLVTASYHMPRSLLEFGRVLPPNSALSPIRSTRNIFRRGGAAATPSALRFRSITNTCSLSPPDSCEAS